MLLFSYAFRAPGFITDPVVDESKNALVQFHCTSFTRRPDGSRMPFLIRNQTDSGGGVALQVQWQVGEPVTMAKLVNLETMLAVPGKITRDGRESAGVPHAVHADGARRAAFVPQLGRRRDCASGQPPAICHSTPARCRCCTGRCSTAIT